MMRSTLGSKLIALALVAPLFSAACSSSTRISPNPISSELTLRFDGGLEVWAGPSPLADSPSWNGLTGYVECVERAKKHAAEAESEGALAGVTSWIGFGLGALSFGGVAGAVADRDHALTWLGAGVGSAALGLIFALTGSYARARADGNAVDAVNFYNDEVGFRGQTCENFTRPTPRPAE